MISPTLRARDRADAARRSRHPPAASPRSRPRASTLLRAAVAQKVVDAPLGQQLRDAVERVAFADGVEIDFEVRLREVDRTPLGVEQDLVAADCRQRRGDFALGRHAALAPQKAPHARQRPAGHVEGAARLGVQPHAQLQQREQPRLDRDRLVEAGD